MIKLYLFERNVFTPNFFTPFSQQVIRNHISETEKTPAKMKIFVTFYTQVGGEIGHSEGYKFGILGTTAFYPTSPTNATRISETGVYVHSV